MVIVVDGPSASGKSSVARALAERLDVLHLESGKIYRSMAWFLGSRNVDISDESLVKKVLEDFSYSTNGLFHSVNGQNITEKLSSHIMGELASRISGFECVRKLSDLIQRSLVTKAAVVEGRDGIQSFSRFKDKGLPESFFKREG